MGSGVFRRPQFGEILMIAALAKRKMTGGVGPGASGLSRASVECSDQKLASFLRSAGAGASRPILNISLCAASKTNKITGKVHGKIGHVHASHGLWTPPRKTGVRENGKRTRPRPAIGSGKMRDLGSKTSKRSRWEAARLLNVSRIDVARIHMGWNCSQKVSHGIKRYPVVQNQGVVFSDTVVVAKTV